MPDVRAATRAAHVDYLKDLVDTLAEQGRVLDRATALFIAEVVKHELYALHPSESTPRQRWADVPTHPC